MAGSMAPFFILLGLAVLLYVLMPRRFYFVRHGETLLNARKVKQGAEGGLSERGKQQAAAVGAALQQMGITRIISSNYPRAIETAKIIQESVHAPILTTALFAERKSPSEVLGKSTHDPLVEKVVNLTELSYHEDEYRYSDEENFMDLKARARKALSLLASQGGRSTCIVTHRAFLKMLIAYMLYRERLHAGDFVKLAFFNYNDNAGITVCEFRPLELFSATRGWRVIAYNQTFE